MCGGDHSAFMGQPTSVRRVLETSASLLDRLIPSITSAYMQELEPAASSSARRAHAPAAPERRKQGGDRGGSRASPEQAALEQRTRIMQALVEVLAERGFAGATIECLPFLAEHPDSSNREVVSFPTHLRRAD